VLDPVGVGEGVNVGVAVSDGVSVGEMVALTVGMYVRVCDCVGVRDKERDSVDEAVAVGVAE
jgi:hypothetical protein